MCFGISEKILFIGETARVTTEAGCLIREDAICSQGPEIKIQQEVSDCDSIFYLHHANLCYSQTRVSFLVCEQPDYLPVVRFQEGCVVPDYQLLQEPQQLPEKPHQQHQWPHPANDEPTANQE